jgi:hypothetical protein
MDREQQWYYQQNQSSLGCGMMLLAIVGALAFLWLLTVTNLYAWLFIPLAAAVAGLLLGLWIARPTRNYDRLNSENRTTSTTRQLVGELCVICRNRIGSIVDGLFCQACGCPVHTKCAQPQTERVESRCPQCGADPSFDKREQS